MLFTSGRLADEDLSWDIAFWQSVPTETRFLATSELIRTAYELKHKCKLEMRVDKNFIQVGSVCD